MSIALTTPIQNGFLCEPINPLKLVLDIVMINKSRLMLTRLAVVFVLLSSTHMFAGFGLETAPMPHLFSFSRHNAVYHHNDLHIAQVFRVFFALVFGLQNEDDHDDEYTLLED
jgi:hypothetical protein